MSNRIVVTTPEPIRVKVTSKSQKRFDPQEVASLLGAEAVSPNVVNSTSPVSLFALRQYLIENLHSSGGRPALVNSTRRQKIPLSDEVWQALTNLANILKADGVSISPAQMASAIIRQGLAQLTAIQVTKTPRRKAA